MKILNSLVGLIVISAFSGCSGMHDLCDNYSSALHNDISALEAWCQWSWCYEDLDHPHDFAKGFKAGYRNILNGGNGCQPTMPPRDYWKPCFRNAEGHCRVNAWFEGFAHGAMAAEQDGVAGYGFIPLSPTARSNFARACQPPQEIDWSAKSVPPAPGVAPAYPGMTPPASPQTTPQPVLPQPGSVRPGGTNPMTPTRPYEEAPRTTGRISVGSIGR